MSAVKSTAPPPASPIMSPRFGDPSDDLPASMVAVAPGAKTTVLDPPSGSATVVVISCDPVLLTTAWPLVNVGMGGVVIVGAQVRMKSYR